MPKSRTIQWQDADKAIPDLKTDVEHEINVQREAIPLVFVPGIMGTRLRRTGTNGKGKGPDKLPNLRWDPSSAMWMIRYVSGESGARRKALLVGPKFDPDYLEPDNDDPIGDGFAGIMEDYCKKFLTPILKERKWGALAKVFEFPVYAAGFNWTGSAEDAGKKLVSRINAIIDEAKKIVGLCEKVIVISHSMGGLVSRWASEMEGGNAVILGIVHGVQPVTGAPAAYWRIKAGFEGFGITSRVLGADGTRVTPVLGNIPGGLQLLPNKLHRTNTGETEWLTVTRDGAATPLIALPTSDPYEEIYRVKAVVKPAKGEKPSTNKYWGLVDPDLLDPGVEPPAGGNEHDEMDADAQAYDPWSDFITLLGKAEQFHDTLGTKAHPHTFCIHGTGQRTADVIEMQVESNWVRSDNYPSRGFRGFFRDAEGSSMQAVLQQPAGDGDATVVRSSGAALDQVGKPAPGDGSTACEHQPAYESAAVQGYAVQAIIALVKQRYEERHGLAKAAGAGAK